MMRLLQRAKKEKKPVSNTNIVNAGQGVHVHLHQHPDGSTKVEKPEKPDECTQRLKKELSTRQKKPKEARSRSVYTYDQNSRPSVTPHPPSALRSSPIDGSQDLNAFITWVKGKRPAYIVMYESAYQALLEHGISADIVQEWKGPKPWKEIGVSIGIGMQLSRLISQWAGEIGSASSHQLPIHNEDSQIPTRKSPKDKGKGTVIHKSIEDDPEALIDIQSDEDCDANDESDDLQYDYTESEL